MEFKFNGVNEAFRTLVDGISRKTIPTIETSSRNGPVIQIEEPVLVKYENPLERVLFNRTRDANPLFHLYESLFMLAGRNEIAPLAYYAKNMINYSDDGVTQNGAYGYRWRHAATVATRPRSVCVHRKSEDPNYRCSTCWGHDQLDLLVAHLKAQPDSRRAVLQMWDVENDLLKIGVPADYASKQGFNVRPADLLPTSRDVCCNLSVMFSLRNDSTCPTCNGHWTSERAKELGEWGDVCPNCEGDPKKIFSPRRFLDMTVTNRSNDMIWGMLGANVVHFSILQEYMAARLGVAVGRYYQFTNNLHVYKTNWKPDEWLEDTTPNIYKDGYPTTMRPGEPYNPSYAYTWRKARRVPLVKDPGVFERELQQVVDVYKPNGISVSFKAGTPVWTEPFFQNVARPMLQAFVWHKEKEYDGIFDLLDEIEDDAWRFAARDWIARRMIRAGVKAE